jgi:hypothetical protein
MGGRNLGVAKGSIEIDTAGLARAAAMAKRAGEEMERALNGAGAAAEKSESRFKRLGRTLSNLRGELTAVGLAGAALSAIGIKTAANIEVAQIRLKGMTGSLVEANKLMAKLDATATEMALPFGDVLQASTMLLPSLEGNTEELGKWLSLVERVAAMAPEQGLTGAAFAVREAMASGGTDLMSLVERFQIERGKLREAMEETGGDFGAALDMVLTQMGMTESAAKDMAKSFMRSFGLAKDAAMQFVGAGFTPMLEIITPLLQKGAEWLTQLRKTNPELATAVSAFASIAAVGAPLVLIIERLGKAFQFLGLAKGFSMLLTLMGSTAFTVGAAAIVGGGTAGAFLAKGVGVATGNQELAETDFDDVIRHLKNLPKNLVIAAEIFAKPDSPIGKYFAERKRMDDLNNAWPSEGDRAIAGGFSAQGARQGTAGRKFTTKQTDIIVQWHRDVTRIEEEAAAQRLSTVENFNRSYGKAVESFGKTMAREAEDFTRARQRATAELQRSIADMRENRARSEAIQQEDFDRKIENIRETHAEKLENIERRAAQRREDLIDGHRDRIAKAASRLDARGIIEENRRFNTAMKKINRDEQEKTATAKENLNDRIEQETEAHEIRLQRARDADEQRIRDMQEDFERQQRIADEDRAIRLQRARDDHDAQLREMADAHERRMDQINKNEQTEKDAATLRMQEQLAEEKLATEAFLTEQQKRRDKALDAFNDWWDDIYRKIRGEREIGDTTSPGTPADPGDQTQPIPFAKGGPVSGTTRALLHSGEYVLNPSTTESLRAMMGNFSQPDLMRAVAGGNRGNTNTSVRIAKGAIIVNEAQRPGMTAREIEGALLSVIQRIQ